MTDLRIDAFTGLDLRSGDRPAGALDVGTNILIDGRGSAVRRPGLVRRATLPAGTLGLYTIDDTLRVVAPNGTSTAGLFPAVLLDYIDVAQPISGAVQAVRLASGRRAVWVGYDDGAGRSAIHITASDPAQTVTGSRLALDFAPTGLIGMGGRLLSLDATLTRLRWSGMDDPAVNSGRGYIHDWSDALDEDEVGQKGGFQPLYTAGSGAIALAEYRGRVAVFSRSAVQLWALDEGGPSSLDQTIGGPGSRHAASIGTMAGDLIYADVGGVVRLLSTDTQTQGAREQGAIGEPVASWTRSLAGLGASPVAIYARALGAYLLASGSEVACLSVVAGQAMGWSRWVLPVAVDGLAECRGTVYVRSGTAVYSLELNAPDDELVSGGTRQNIAVALRPAPAVARGRALLSQVSAAVGGAGSSTIRAVVDGVATATAPIVHRAPRFADRMLTRSGRGLSLEVACANAGADWRCDGMRLSAQEE
jgi:hypothetical protein